MWCSAPAGRRDRATPSCCLPRARATTCSRTTRNAGRRSGRSWSRCEGRALGDPPAGARGGGAGRVRADGGVWRLEPADDLRRAGRLEFRPPAGARGGGRRGRCRGAGALGLSPVGARPLARPPGRPPSASAAGARIGHFLTIAVVATPILFGAVASAQYRLARVVTFLNPGSAPSEATWQVHQSLVGMGAGRLFGVGLGQGQQKLGYLPYAYSDFIFSTIGEE